MTCLKPQTRKQRVWVSLKTRKQRPLFNFQFPRLSNAMITLVCPPHCWTKQKKRLQWKAIATAAPWSNDFVQLGIIICGENSDRLESLRFRVLVYLETFNKISQNSENLRKKSSFPQQPSIFWITDSSQITCSGPISIHPYWPTNQRGRRREPLLQFLLKTQNSHPLSIVLILMFQMV